MTINGRPFGNTPLTTQLKRESGQTVTFAKAGYKPVSMKLDTDINGWFWGNIAIGGLLGSSTDGVTGAIHKYSPSQYLIVLEPEGATQLESKTSLSKDQKAKEFIVVGYSNLKNDIAKGKGEYLNSLEELLEIPEEARAEATKKIKSLSEVYSNIADFADKVTELFAKDKKEEKK